MSARSLYVQKLLESLIANHKERRVGDIFIVRAKDGVIHVFDEPTHKDWASGKRISETNRKERHERTRAIKFAPITDEELDNIETPGKQNKVSD